MNKKFWKEGEPYVWGTGLLLGLVLLLTVILLTVVIRNGFAVFWPQEVALLETTVGEKIIGEIVREETEPFTGRDRIQLKTGNRDLYGIDFRWINRDEIATISYPQNIIVLERNEYGNFYGFLQNGPTPSPEPSAQLDKELTAIAPLKSRVKALDRKITSLNHKLERIQLSLATHTYNKTMDSDDARRDLAEKEKLHARFDTLVDELSAAQDALHAPTALFVDASGLEKKISLAEIVRQFQPNSMGVFAKTGYYLARLKELFFDEPRESNTEGGLFPAIFGTIMLVFMMSIISFPLGVLAGIYLREYAREGFLVKMVRIAVNNLAGIPSIVYGIFGLGFFVYGIGSTIDQFFFPERLPAPTFGTGGILWASLTLGLLTLPVVIVATEEALGSIPPGIREGSQALAATKFQTLTKLLLPMASPGIMTGFILAMARAAGEVAPLMITGVVKLAPALPIDGTFPYLHLDRKFMHLGFHIYDIGFQSPNVEAAKPMVYVTTLLLILIVLVMTSSAIYLRNRMRERYAIVDV